MKVTRAGFRSDPDGYLRVSEREPVEILDDAGRTVRGRSPRRRDGTHPRSRPREAVPHHLTRYS